MASSIQKSRILVAPLDHIFKNLHHFFDDYTVARREHNALVKSTTNIFFKILWPSQKTQTILKLLSSSSSTCIKDRAAHAKLSIPHNKLPSDIHLTTLKASTYTRELQPNRKRNYFLACIKR